MTKLHYRTLKTRAEAYERSVWNRAWALAQEAGCGVPIHMHNAMCGNPWPEIDYKKLRKANWVMSRQWDAHNALDALYSRKGPEAFDWN